MLAKIKNTDLVEGKEKEEEHVEEADASKTTSSLITLVRTPASLKTPRSCRVCGVPTVFRCGKCYGAPFCSAACLLGRPTSDTSSGRESAGEMGQKEAGASHSMDDAHRHQMDCDGLDQHGAWQDEEFLKVRTASSFAASSSLLVNYPT